MSEQQDGIIIDSPNTEQNPQDIEDVTNQIEIQETENNVDAVSEPDAITVEEVLPEPEHPTVTFFCSLKEIVYSNYPNIISEQLAKNLLSAHKQFPALDDISSMKVGLHTHCPSKGDAHITVSFTSQEQPIQISFFDAAYKPIQEYQLSLPEIKDGITQDVLYPPGFIEYIKNIGDPDLIVQEVFVDLHTSRDHIHSDIHQDHMTLVHSLVC